VSIAWKLVAQTIAVARDSASTESAFAAKELASTAHSQTALVNLFALDTGSVRAFPANASRDGPDSIVELKVARWFPTAQDMAIASRGNASVRRVGRVTSATSSPLVLEIATTEDCVSRESAIAEVDMVELPVRARSVRRTALDMVRAFEQRSALQVLAFNALVNLVGLDLTAPCQTAPTSAPTTAFATTEHATATTSGRVLTALFTRSLAPTIAQATEFALKS